MSWQRIWRNRASAVETNCVMKSSRRSLRDVARGLVDAAYLYRNRIAANNSGAITTGRFAAVVDLLAGTTKVMPRILWTVETMDILGLEMRPLMRPGSPSADLDEHQRAASVGCGSRATTNRSGERDEFADAGADVLVAVIEARRKRRCARSTTCAQAALAPACGQIALPIIRLRASWHRRWHAHDCGTCRNRLRRRVVPPPAGR